MNPSLQTLFSSYADKNLSMVELQSQLIDMAHDAIMVCDPRRCIYTWNRGAEQLYGWTEEEARGHITHELLNAQFPVPLSQIERQLFDEGQWEGELIHTCRDGRRVIVESRWVLKRDEQGNPLAIMEVNRDITVRKQAEFEQEERMQLALNAVQMGMWEWDLVTGHIEWTVQCKALFGLPPDTVVNYDLFLKMLHPEDRERVRQAPYQSLKEHKLYEIEYRVVWPDESVHWIASRGRGGYDERGNAVRITGLVHDITERKQLEQRVRLREKEIQALRNSPIIGIVSADRDYILAANNAFLDMVGYTREDLQAKRMSWSKMTPPEYAPLDERGMQEMLEHGACTPFEKAYYRKDGSLVHILIGAALQQREPLQWVCFILDISERKRVEEALKRSEIHFQTLAEHIPDIVARIDNTMRYLYVNPAITRITGLLPEVFKGKTNEELGMPTELLEQWNAAVQQVFATKQTCTFEVMFSAPTQTRYMQTSLTPELDAQGQILSVLSVGRDVTELKSEQTRLQSSLNALLEVAGTLSVDTPDFNVYERAKGRREITSNVLKPVCDVLACRGVFMVIFTPQTEIVEDIIGVGFDKAIEHDIRTNVCGVKLNSRLSASTMQQLRVGRSVHLDMRHSLCQSYMLSHDMNYCLLVPLLQDSQLFGLIALYPSRINYQYDENEIALAGAIGKLSALLIDREYILYEREEAKAKALAAQEANRRMDEFLGIVSHELRTPLTTIRGNIQLAERRVMSLAQSSAGHSEAMEETIQMVERLLQRADRQVSVQNRLVNDLLDVSRIHADRLELHPELCDVWHIVHEAVEDQRQIMISRTLRLETPHWEALIFADADRVGQVVGNYLSNALKYSDATQPVEVRVERIGTSVRVAVQDWGPGLPIEMQQRVWERFYRVPGIAVKSGSGVGLGLGLHICKTIIERQGGKVGVISQPGQGSAFWFTLPLAEHELS